MIPHIVCRFIVGYHVVSARRDLYRFKLATEIGGLNPPGREPVFVSDAIEPSGRCMALT
jgi:hypothetical protein